MITVGVVRARSLLTPALTLALALTVACTPAGSPADGSSGASGDPVPTTSIVTRTSAPQTVVSTLTQTVTGGPVVAQPPASTMEPAPVAGQCPYLSTETARKLTGQGLSTPQIIEVAPFPVCTFNRSNGAWAATVRIIEAPTPEQAVAAVNQHVPVADSFPASHPEGWSGGVMSQGGQHAGAEGLSVYAVSKGTIAVVVSENESRSIKARQLAECAIFGAGLDPATPPEYCGL